MDVRRDFSSLLEDLADGSPAEPAGQVSRAGMAFDYLAVADELHSGRIRVSAEAAAGYQMAAETLDAEFDALFAEVAAPDIVMPVVDPAAIAAELALDGCDAHGLAQTRRAFALGNHPDRAPPEQRERAVQRMQIANSLIDDALRRVAKPR